MLLFLGGLSIIAGDGDLLVVAFGFGFALLAALYAFGEVSGGHFNPAVSLAAYLGKRINATTMVQYWVAQTGGFVAAGLGLLIVFDRDTVASTATVPSLGVGSALLLEAVMTAVFVVVILTVTKSNQFRGSVFAAISLTLVGINLAAAPLSGASVNPGRTLGSAVIGSEYTHIWVYFAGPLLGAALGWILYGLVTVGKVEAR